MSIWKELAQRKSSFREKENKKGHSQGRKVCNFLQNRNKCVIPLESSYSPLKMWNCCYKARMGRPMKFPLSSVPYSARSLSFFQLALPIAQKKKLLSFLIEKVR